MNELLLSCFYRALWEFLRGDQTLEVFAPSSLCVWSQMPWRNLQIKVSLCTNSFYDLTDCQNLWWRGYVSPKTSLILSKKFHNFWIDFLSYSSTENCDIFRIFTAFRFCFRRGKNSIQTQRKSDIVYGKVLWLIDVLLSVL